MSQSQESRRIEGNPTGREGSADAGALARTLGARVRWAQQALSPWVQRWLGSGEGGGARAERHASTALSASHTRLLLGRVQRTVARATAWRPDVGSLEPGLVDRFAGAIVARFPDVGAKYGVREPEAGAAQAVDLVLAGERAEGPPLTARHAPSLAAIQQEMDEARARSAQPQPARPRTPPQIQREVPARRATPAAPTLPPRARVFSRVEEIAGLGEPPFIEPEASTGPGPSVEGEAPDLRPAALPAQPETKGTPRPEPEAPASPYAEVQGPTAEEIPEPEAEVSHTEERAAVPPLSEVQRRTEEQPLAPETPEPSPAKVLPQTEEGIPAPEPEGPEPPSAEVQPQTEEVPPLAEVPRPTEPRTPAPKPEAPRFSAAVETAPVQRQVEGDGPLPPEWVEEQAARPEPPGHEVAPGQVEASGVQRCGEGQTAPPTRSPAEETVPEASQAPALPASALEPEEPPPPPLEPELAIPPTVEPPRPPVAQEMPLERQVGKESVLAPQPQVEMPPVPRAAYGKVTQTKPLDQTAVLPQVRARVRLEGAIGDARRSPGQPPLSRPRVYTPPGALHTPRGVVAPRQEREPEGLAADAAASRSGVPEREGPLPPAAALPAAVVQRQPDGISAAGVGSAPGVLDAGTGRDTTAEREKAESELDELARQVYPLIKRLLAVERERTASRY